jgi:P27 family predicted phage terminase small subunit
MTRKLSLVSTELREPPDPIAKGGPPAAASPEPAAGEFAVPVGLEPPEEFDGQRRLEWVRIVSRATHLDQSDRHVIEVLVDAIVLHREAAENVRRIGTLIKSSKGVPMQNPYLPVKNKQAALIARYSDALGLSPASRTRGKFKVNKTPAKTFSAFAHLKDRGAFK